MITLDSIFGHARVVHDLRRAVASGRVHHAYLFEGPRGVGKATMARALAATLNCEALQPGSGRTSGCGTCDACRKIDAGTHPDFVVVDMTAKGLTERVRGLRGELGFAPHEGRARVFVLDPAEALAGAQEGRTEAANVLLKTLEEPPPATYFILISAEARRLPVTVLSRCQRLRFGGLTEADLARFAVEQRGAAPDAAARAARSATLSAGGIGALVAALESTEEASPEVAQAASILAPCAAGPERFERAASLGADREELDRVLARAEATLAAELRDGVAGATATRTTAELLLALTALAEARESTRGNVAPALVLEHVLAALARHAAPANVPAPSRSARNTR